MLVTQNVKIVVVVVVVAMVVVVVVTLATHSIERSLLRLLIG